MAGLSTKRPRVQRPPRNPLILYDGGCGLCRRWVDWGRWLVNSRADFLPSQQEGERFPEIESETFTQTVILIEPNGRYFTAAEAVFRLLALRRGFRWLLFLYRKAPGFASTSEWIYRKIARHRPRDCSLIPPQ